jgi:hypothetical protein
VFFGIGLSYLFAIFFAVHALRTGRQIYWLMILFIFPIVGSVVYFIVEFMPEMRVGASVNKVTSVAGRALDPTRDLRQARDALDMTPTAQNRMLLARALMNADQPAEAAAQFEECLKGPFASDPEIAYLAAQAHLASNQPARALELLLQIRSRDANFRQELLAVKIGQALLATGDNAAAGVELRQASERFGGIESRGEYAIWAANNGDPETARQLQRDLQKSYANWSGQTRAMHKPLMKRVDAAVGAVAS